MRSSGFRSRFVLAALLLAVTACQSGTPQAHSSPSPRASASPSATADAARCARLAERHFTPCPPLASELKLPPTTIKNATDGAIDDATAQKWGRAFQLGQAYYYWAMEQNARDALTAGVLADSSATGNLFGPDLEELDQAKREGGTLVSQFLATPITQVVVVPPSSQSDMQRQGLAWKPYGLAVRFKGPASRVIRHQDGTQVTLSTYDSNQVFSLLTWGELKQDPELGPIWYQYGYYDCNGPMSSVCRM
jgi:hypothetical protein